MTNPITIYFELENEADVANIQANLANGLAQIPIVEESEVQQPEQRVTGAEIVAAIGAAIIIAKTAKEAVNEINGLVESLIKLTHSIKGLKSAIIETPSGPKNLEEATADDIKDALGS